MILVGIVNEQNVSRKARDAALHPSASIRATMPHQLKVTALPHRRIMLAGNAGNNRFRKQAHYIVVENAAIFQIRETQAQDKGQFTVARLYFCPTLLPCLERQ